MDDIQAISRALPNIDILESRIPFELFEKITKEIETPTQELEEHNNNLLGHIKEEYKLTHLKDDMSEYILECAKIWAEENPGVIESYEEVRKADDWDFELDDPWYNLQKKHEFNPIHHHSGVLSFVMFIKIPYDLAEEDKVYPSISGKESYTSKFYFAYTDVLGRTRQLALPVTKDWEGTMLMFPATLHHGVYPFYTSDEYRITVSGNVNIKVVE